MTLFPLQCRLGAFSFCYREKTPVAIETEVKISIGDAPEFVRSLGRMNPVETAPRHFEDNFLLDYPDRRMYSKRSLVRVRMTDHGSFLTFKGQPREAGKFKSREEVESRVEDGLAVLRVLKELGLRTWFRYQKYRHEYKVSASGIAGAVVIVAVDETPIGNFVEFEGTEAGIQEIAAAMGFSEADYLRDSYYALYSQSCNERGVPAEDMVFPPGSQCGPGGCGREF